MTSTPKASTDTPNESAHEPGRLAESDLTLWHNSLFSRDTERPFDCALFKFPVYLTLENESVSNDA